MKAYRKTLFGYLFLLTALNFGISSATAAPYQSLNGLTGLEIAYDFRIDDPKKAALFLKLIHETYSDKDINQLTKSPRFVVVFNGAAVKLIAEEQQGFSQEDQVYLREIANRISLMAADGIRLEGCLKAAEIFQVDPNLFLGDIKKINNAWISLAGYQAQRFSALPID